MGIRSATRLTQKAGVQPAFEVDGRHGRRGGAARWNVVKAVCPRGQSRSDGG